MLSEQVGSALASGPVEQSDTAKFVKMFDKYVAMVCSQSLNFWVTGSLIA